MTLLRFVFLAITSQQQQRASQALFAGIEELIDQVFLGPNVACCNI